MGEEQSLSRSSIFTGSLKALSCCLSRDSILPSRAAVASRLEDVTSSPGGLSTSSAADPPPSLAARVAAVSQWESEAVIDVSRRDRGLTGPTDRWSGGQLMDWLPGHQHHPTPTLPLLPTLPPPLLLTASHISATITTASSFLVDGLTKRANRGW